MYLTTLMALISVDGRSQSSASWTSSILFLFDLLCFSVIFSVFDSGRVTGKRHTGLEEFYAWFLGSSGNLSHVFIYFNCALQYLKQSPHKFPACEFFIIFHSIDGLSLSHGQRLLTKGSFFLYNIPLNQWSRNFPLAESKSIGSRHAIIVKVKIIQFI